MIGEIVGLLASVISGIASSKSHNQYSSTLGRMGDDLRVPESMRRAETIFREQANTGLPYAEEMKAEAESGIPTTLNQIKDYVSGGQMVDALANLYSQSNKQKRSIDIENANMLNQNKSNYANFLSSSLAGSEQNVSDQQLALKLAQAQEGVNATKDKLYYGNEGAKSFSLDGLTKILSGGDFSSWLAGLFAKGDQPNPLGNSGVNQNLFSGMGSDLYGSNIDPMKSIPFNGFDLK